MTYYISISAIIIAIMIMMVIHVNKSNTVQADARKAFTIGFIMTATCAACEMISIGNNVIFNLEPHILNKIMSLEYAIAPVIVLAWTKAIHSTHYTRLTIPLLIMNCCLQFISSFKGYVLYFDDACNYHVGEYYWIYLVTYIIVIFALFAEIWHFSKKYQHRNAIPLIISFVFMMFGVVACNMSSETVHFVWFAVTTCGLMVYIYYIELIIQTDQLTSLLNRRLYDSYIDDIQYDTAVIILDVDDFKYINDTYGHAYGDSVLETVASIILQAYRKKGLCFRIGGDEFCVILKRHHRLDEAGLKKLNSHFYELLRNTRKSMPILPNVSIGYAFRFGNTPIQQTAEKADMMMYKHKRATKSR